MMIMRVFGRKNLVSEQQKTLTDRMDAFSLETICATFLAASI